MTMAEYARREGLKSKPRTDGRRMPRRTGEWMDAAATGPGKAPRSARRGDRIRRHNGEQYAGVARLDAVTFVVSERPRAELEIRDIGRQRTRRSGFICRANSMRQSDLVAFQF
jgi:hypothetical protein